MGALNLPYLRKMRASFFCVPKTSRGKFPVLFQFLVFLKSCVLLSLCVSCGVSRHLQSYLRAELSYLAQSPAPLTLYTAVTRARCYFHSWPR